MSDPLTINDLRVSRGLGHGWRRVTPAEFADIARQEGWVKLEGIDVERSDLRAAFTMLETLMDLAPTDEDLRLLKVVDRCVGIVARLVLAPDDPSRNIHAELAEEDRA